MSSIGKTFSYELQLFCQICTPQEGTKIGRNAFTLHSAVSQYVAGHVAINEKKGNFRVIIHEQSLIYERRYELNIFFKLTSGTF